MKGKISCRELLGLIPEEFLKEIGESTKVDYQVKKLEGKVIFQLLLYSLLKGEKMSLRVLEEVYN